MTFADLRRAIPDVWGLAWAVREHTALMVLLGRCALRTVQAQSQSERVYRMRVLAAVGRHVRARAAWKELGVREVTDAEFDAGWRHFAPEALQYYVELAQEETERGRAARAILYAGAWDVVDTLEISQRGE